jgi:proline dehydrogenase
MRKEIGEIKAEQAEMRKEIGEIKVEQNEMRKEIAFFYGSLMREIDNSRVEARSQFKYLEAVVDRHRGAIELLGERTKDAGHKDN